jgi:UDP-glucose 4-epimerase
MTVLVTGGNGSVGSHVARQLLQGGDQVVIYDSAPIHPKNNALAEFDPHQLKVEFGNVDDLASVLEVVKKHDVEGIIHLAAVSRPYLANRQPIAALKVNVIGTANILEAGRLLGLQRVIVTSSAGAMGTAKDLVTPRKEDEIELPIAGMYPLTKLACEQLVHTYRQIFHLDASAIRPRNVYGPGFAFLNHPLFILVFEALAGNDVIKGSGGDSTFDYTYVKDLARGFVQLYKGPAPGHHVYNVSAGHLVKVSEIAAIVQDLFPDLTISVGPGGWPGLAEVGREAATETHAPPVMPPLDISRAREDFGYQPQWTLQQGIADWVRWAKTGVVDDAVGK